MKPLVYLASNSPRRFELLQQIGVSPQKIYIEVDETVLADEAGEDYVKRVTLLKAHAALEQKQQQFLPKAPIVVADTVVLWQNRIFGKPKNTQHAKEILTMLSGQTHEVITSVCVICSGFCSQQTQTTEIRLKTLTEAEIDAYIASGEPLDKAGAYGIQGLGALFVSHLSGSYSGVVGLPLYETANLLEKVGVSLL